MLAPSPSEHPFAGLALGTYGVILADPPWRYKVYSAKGEGRSASRHYPTMTLPEVRALPVADVAAPDCWLFLWITTPFAALGAHKGVMRDWGFVPSSLGFCWAKLQNREEEALFVSADDSFHVGMGHTTRHNIELCFLGRRGNPKRLSRSVRELIVAPVREHSRKPVEQYERIESFAAGPYLELFARNRRPGWDCWGNEVEKFAVERIAGAA